MNTHTPGPWEIHAGNEIWSENDQQICRTCGYNEDSHEANARLIAAAPDLLAACKEAEFLGAYGIGCGGPDKDNTTRCIEEIKRIQRMLKAAIQKATGEK